MATSRFQDGSLALRSKEVPRLDLEAVPPPSPDRRFRPDVEGMRAIAVGLVVMYHAHIPPFRGGFVGVDVFFVISGFLITGLLLNEQERHGRISILNFYARRVRRILPALTVVLLATVFASYHWLGFLSGNLVADDARWTAIFAANFHFAFVGTSYFGSQQAPSPLLHMWSLGVEEQFYVLWPTLLLVVAFITRKHSLRVGLAVVLTAIVASSLSWSVIETSTSSTWAYYSPLTRAFELSGGALLAVSIPLLKAIPRRVAHGLGIVGLCGIVSSAVVLSASTLYPGAAAIWPVASAMALIAAGSASANHLSERVLATAPFQWLGARSYSLYLWHWPLLIIPAEAAEHSLAMWQNLCFVAVAIVISALSYRFVENPIRRARALSKRPVVSVGIGFVLIGLVLVVMQWQLHVHG